MDTMLTTATEAAKKAGEVILTILMEMFRLR